MSSKINGYENYGEYPQSTQDTPSKSVSLFHWGVVILFLVIIIMLSGEVFKANSNQWSMESMEVAFPDTDTPISSTVLPTPETSVLSTNYDTTSATCPLTVKAGAKDYYLKVCDTKHGSKVIAQFFIRSNEKLKTALPTGTYMLKYISGSQWYGEEDMFGLFGDEGRTNPLQLGNDHSCKQGKIVVL
ncbi:MAG: hypothetical protein WA080_06515 [Sulfuricurvum sp.]